MSIITRTGDNGTTGLMYNRRVSKTHPRVEAYGAVDELNSGLGLARATAGPTASFHELLLAAQKDLVILMGELATAPEDLERYVRDGFSLVTEELTQKLEARAREIESQLKSFRGWATPGNNQISAALDLARTICRRAERQVVALEQAGQLKNSEIIKFLNRLSDLLWLLARQAES